MAASSGPTVTAWRSIGRRRNPALAATRAGARVAAAVIHEEERPIRREYHRMTTPASSMTAEPRSWLLARALPAGLLPAVRRPVQGFIAGGGRAFYDIHSI